MEKRKKEHIDLTFQSQSELPDHDTRFYYEPVLNPHPVDDLQPFIFLGKKLRIPLWVSSMTGGTLLAGKINANLARACREFGMGMGLGSCRILLNDSSDFADFNLRDIIGYDLPFYANLGISQIEQLMMSNKIQKAHDLVKKLKADGLIVHINPLQEWFQPEGDRLIHSPLDSMKRFLDTISYPVIVKEVGQGMGPESLKELLKLPLEAIEFGAFGGTNFTNVELLRNDDLAKQQFEPFSKIGETAIDMVDYINKLISEGIDNQCRQIIVSGGIKSFVDGYYLIRKCKLPAIYGQASTLLEYAKESYADLHKFLEFQVNGLKLAFQYLVIKD